AEPQHQSAEHHQRDQANLGEFSVHRLEKLAPMLVRCQNRADVRLLRSELSRKTCPRCGRRTGAQAARCRGCRYRYPEKSSPKPAGLAMGAGFPLFLVGTLILLSRD